MSEDAPTPELMARYEQWAEEAYDRMYDAGRTESKDCYEDACVYLIRASKVAEALGREDEKARLNARLEHIIAVWNSQFRSSRI